MHVCSVITYTPFMAGVKEYEGFFEKKTMSPTNHQVIGYGHKILEEERDKYDDVIMSRLEAHNLLISDMDKIGHIVVEKLPKTDTCPHWLRAWCDYVYDCGICVLENDIAKAFLNMDYELVPELMSSYTPRGKLRRMWDAQIHLYGTYGIIKSTTPA